MAELTISPDEIRAALDAHVNSFEPQGTKTEEVGAVVLAADGIAQVEGLPGVMANELVRFEDGSLGLALNLDVRTIGVVVLGEFTGIEEGQSVHRTGEVLSIEVGDGYLGRVVDPLVAERVNDAAQVAVADLDREDLSRAVHGLALLDAGELAEHHHTDRAHIEVQREAKRAVLKAHQLVRHDPGKTLNLGNSVGRKDDGADLFGLRTLRLK